MEPKTPGTREKIGNHKKLSFWQKVFRLIKNVKNQNNSDQSKDFNA